MCAAGLDTSAIEFRDKINFIRTVAPGITSGYTADDAAKIYAKRIDDSVQARLDGLLEGYDLYGVPLDDQLVSSMIDEVMALKDTQLRNIEKSMSVSTVDRANMSPSVFAQMVKNTCKVSRASVIVQVERRRRSNPKEATVMNVYHLTGAGSRVNVNSTDNSTNVTISESELFSKMREEISEKVPSGEGRDRLLQKVSALEKERDLPSAWERYKELITVAADHMALICPFIPALTEMIGKAIR